MNIWYRIAASGNVGAATGGSTLRSVTLTGGSDAATLTIKDGGSGGTQIGPIIKAAAATTVHVLFGAGVGIGGQLYGALTGTGPEVGFEVGD